MSISEIHPLYAMEESTSISGKAAVITGGTTGIGRATGLLLASHGARVLICGRHEPELRDALKEFKETKGEAYGIIADIAEKKDIKRLFEEADRKLGPVDILVNNAAISAGSVTEGKYDDWQYVLSANLLGHMALCREAWERMKKNGGGHIVNIGSMSADAREGGTDVYVATKTAIQGFSEAFRKKVNADGVKVTLIEPGNVGTDMADELPEEQVKEEIAGRMLKAEDIAHCVYYCLVQPPRCDVIRVQIRPHQQAI